MLSASQGSHQEVLSFETNLAADAPEALAVAIPTNPTSTSLPSLLHSQSPWRLASANLVTLQFTCRCHPQYQSTASTFSPQHLELEQRGILPWMAFPAPVPMAEVASSVLANLGVTKCGARIAPARRCWPSCHQTTNINPQHLPRHLP